MTLRREGGLEETGREWHLKDGGLEQFLWEKGVLPSSSCDVWEPGERARRDSARRPD